ncbi:MAG: nickel-responsive transcriptional regulator NikR [Methylomonas sp.]|nr:nickel-responsive transcriptional regulator NikR [Methylomonas sp.]
MERFTISLSDELAADFDHWLQARGYVNRSEAVRDLLRKEIETERLANDQATHCVASLSYVYNHHERSLAERLTHLQHHAHDLVVCSMHVHLDHEDCLESLFLRGSTQVVRGFAEKICAESGVRHGSVNLVPVDPSATEHSHTHFHPLT